MDSQKIEPLTRHTHNTFYQRVGKRVLELGIVAISVPFLLPVLALVAAAVWAKIGRPVLFRQVRAGKNGKEFLLYKFRTMTNLRDEHGQLAADHLRVTKLGQFLRHSSLDELPGLWNVVRGDINLVGPRPLLVEYLELYTVEQFLRHEVKSGLTGLAQVNGRNSLSWEEKFTYDVQYVRTYSMWLDLKILGQTFFSVLRRDGISAKGHTTMPAFTGIKQATVLADRRAA
jgi:lipopolysaccharide/colanic/teichoic acid biosynthesis glycosyltransferase